MCTLIYLRDVVPGYPVVVLHARYLDSGTREEPPSRVMAGRNVYRPLDVASGGTWVGFNDAGLLVAVTNQETEFNGSPGRSRGLLAMDLLGSCASAAEAKETLMDPEIRPAYRRGNFLVADPREAWHVVWDMATWAYELGPGGHVITTLTMAPGIEWTERAEKMWVNVERRRIRALELLVQPRPQGIDAVIGELRRWSADHGHGRGQGSICYHDPSGKNAETSATIIAIGDKLENSRILYCPGNPCVGEYRDYSGILAG